MKIGVLFVGLFAILLVACKKEPTVSAGSDNVENNGNTGDDTEGNTTYFATYKIVDTGVIDCYDNSQSIAQPQSGDEFYGQDGNYYGNQPSYTDNGDGTITDNVTGLIWEKEMGAKMSFVAAFEKASDSNLGGYDDWRVPTIKELYSLILFTGKCAENVNELFIDTNYFNHPLGDESIGERVIDAQTWSATEYVGRTMLNDETIFGVNFIDGRIKGYPKYDPRTRSEYLMYVRLVRGTTEYGKNNLVDNGDGTVSDLATGLMWQKADDGVARDWEAALIYAEEQSIAGYSDWRLPNIKELQSIVDYTRSPQTTQSPAISALFETTEINDPDGNSGHYPHFWSSTVHLDGATPEANAAYIAFGEGLGKMNGQLLDVHGAGSQRSDPKTGDPANYPEFVGPQGDVRCVFNYVRCVRNIAN